LQVDCVYRFHHPKAPGRDGTSHQPRREHVSAHPILVRACLQSGLISGETICPLHPFFTQEARSPKQVLIVRRNAYRMRLDGVAYTTYVLITVFVPLKIWCRRRAGGWANVGSDDYLTVIALLIANGFFWTCMIGMFCIRRQDYYNKLTQVSQE
jgi:hypothetical protein